MENKQIKNEEIIHGFQVKSITELPEIEGTFYEMEHLQTGARLGWLKNTDENMTFSVSFKTIPKDDTGVFHILEHSVLQGSEAYPVKAPFLHMMKTSMNTFLNAMTFPDKTMFPVASRNEKDFKNLIRIYMDAVLHPLLHKNENIFRQEGWHYECVEDGLIYNGVVLNEMRGDHSSVDSLLYTEVARGLFPDNCYRFESGGDPKYITDLTYEDFCKTHEQFYHPSNAYFVLDGNMDIEALLALFNDEFLADYKKRDCDFTIPIQKPVKAYEERPFAAEDETGYLGLGFVIGSYEDRKKIYAASILADYLAENNESPFKKEILERELGFDVEVMASDDGLQPFMLFKIRNIDPERRSEVEEVFAETVENLYKRGIDQAALEALLCKYEFEAKEHDFGGEPEGVINCINVLQTWLYGGNPVAMFENDAIFQELREEIANGGFVAYLKEFFIDNIHTASVLMRPSETFLAEEQQAEEAKLQKFCQAYDEQKKREIADREEALKRWQSVPNTAEELQCMPRLELDDISPEPMQINTEILSDGTCFHGLASRGITYLQLYFPIGKELLDHISVVAFMSQLFGEIRLKEMDIAALAQEKRRIFGEFQASVQAVPQYLNAKETKFYFCIAVSYLQEKEAEALELLQDILQNTDFTDTDAIADILYQQQEMCHQEMIMDGHSMAMLQAKSRLSQTGKRLSAAQGPDFSNWIDSMTENLEVLLPELSDVMQHLDQKILVSDDMFVGVTSDGEKKAYTTMLKEKLAHSSKEMRDSGEEAELVHFMKKMKDSEKEAELAHFMKKMKDSGEKVQLPGISAENVHNTGDNCDFIEIQAPVAYSAMAGLLYTHEIENSGAWAVLAKLVSMDYLWNEVRVLGGAYGTGMSANVDDFVGYFSYRDPNPENSLKTFRSVPEFLKKYCSEVHDLTGVKIGAIADTEPVLSVKNKGKVADNWALANITDEERIRHRRQMLDTDQAQIGTMAEALEAMGGDMSCCIVKSE